MYTTRLLLTEYAPPPPVSTRRNADSLHGCWSSGQRTTLGLGYGLATAMHKAQFHSAPFTSVCSSCITSFSRLRPTGEELVESLVDYRIPSLTWIWGDCIKLNIKHLFLFQSKKGFKGAMTKNRGTTSFL